MSDNGPVIMKFKLSVFEGDQLDEAFYTDGPTWIDPFLISRGYVYHINSRMLYESGVRDNLNVAISSRVSIGYRGLGTLYKIVKEGSRQYSVLLTLAGL